MSAQPSPTTLSFGSVNIAGLQLQYHQAIDLMISKNLTFLAIQETWLRPLQSLGPLQHLIVSDSRPHKDINYHSGTLIIRNPNKTTKEDFQHRFSTYQIIRQRTIHMDKIQRHHHRILLFIPSTSTQRIRRNPELSEPTSTHQLQHTTIHHRR